MEIYSVIKVIHIVTAILMAWPFYALVVVNQRARLGPPLGDRVDIYMETIIRNRVIPCYVFQATALVSGLTMVFLSLPNLASFFQNPNLVLKFGLLLLNSSLLSYVHFKLQPEIDALFAEFGSTHLPATSSQIGRLRLRRKQVASICLFSVLTISMLGVQAWKPLPIWVTIVMLGWIVIFTWRGYKSVPRFGWF